MQTGEQGEGCFAAPSRWLCLFLHVGTQGAHLPSPAAPLLFCETHSEGDFPWFVHPVPFSRPKSLGRIPGKAMARCDHDHVLVQHLSFSVHPLSDFTDEAATWKNGHKVYSQSPCLRLLLPPSSYQNILASVSRGGNLEKCQTLLSTIKLLFKEYFLK